MFTKTKVLLAHTVLSWPFSRMPVSKYDWWASLAPHSNDYRCVRSNVHYCSSSKTVHHPYTSTQFPSFSYNLSSYCFLSCVVIVFSKVILISVKRILNSENKGYFLFLSKLHRSSEFSSIDWLVSNGCLCHFSVHGFISRFHFLWYIM